MAHPMQSPSTTTGPARRRHRAGLLALAPILACGAALLGPAGDARAAYHFQAFLDGSQETTPTPSAATGLASLILNDAQNRLWITLSLTLLDLDGNQTPSNSDDNVTGLHIHNAPPGTNGGVVFGFISPNNDANGDLVIDAAAGTVTSAWDLNEGNGTTLSAQLPDLFAGNLYFNVHTPAYPPGEIRGQITVPVPAAAALIPFGLLPLAALAHCRRVRAVAHPARTA
jgi:hypothetical protein